MPSLQQFRESVQTIDSIKLITQALGDIATNQIKKTRHLVEQNIKYYEQVSRVYQIVKIIAAREANFKHQQPPKNGKTAVLLLTSNYRYYGGLDYQVSKFFADQTQKYRCERIIVGHSGVNIWATFKQKFSIETIKFKEDFPNLEELKLLSTKISNYSKVYVYYSKFTTLLDLAPTVSDISETEENPDRNAIIKLKYILEPEIKQMFAFFENEIRVLLLQAIFLDCNIARTAARMISMNQAQGVAENINQNKNVRSSSLNGKFKIAG